LNFFVLSVVGSSIAEPFAVTREIHHNHGAGSACRRPAESLTFDASRATAARPTRIPEVTAMLDVNTARRQMIEQQVRAWEVLDLRVLEAMQRVPREEFAPAALRDLAFADTGIPLGHGQHMLAPKLEGRLLQALELSPDDTVLEIGTGSGYFAACLGALARSVTSIEIHADLAATARASLDRNNVHNVTVETADAFGRADPARYDAVVLTGSLPVYDARFEQWLAAGGRLLVVVGQGPVMEARRITLTHPGELLRESLFETVMDPLIHATEPPKFVF
jgi:protein-L-isoaspartate(D-aspartate) O-methyltransferase